MGLRADAFGSWNRLEFDVSAHTPGPWEVVQDHYPCFKEVRGPSFKVSSVMWATDLTEQDYEKRNADLVLIAAAPELLSWLKWSLNLLPGDVRQSGQYEMALAAVATATGGAA